MNIVNGRAAWIDNARMFAMSCVVIAHIKSAMGTPCTQGFSYWIVSYNMPLFVILSSYLAYNGISKVSTVSDLVHTLEKYALRIAFPTLFATSFLGCISIFSGDMDSLSDHLMPIFLLVGLIILWYLLSARRYNLILEYVTLFLIPASILYCGYWFMKMLLIMAVCFATLSFVSNKIGRVGGGVFFVISLCGFILIQRSVCYRILSILSNRIIYKEV